jgi:hypothetical protein
MEAPRACHSCSASAVTPGIIFSEDVRVGKHPCVLKLLRVEFAALDKSARLSLLRLNMIENEGESAALALDIARNDRATPADKGERCRKTAPDARPLRRSAWAERLLTDRQCALVERPRPRKVALGLENLLHARRYGKQNPAPTSGISLTISTVP